MTDVDEVVDAFENGMAPMFMEGFRVMLHRYPKEFTEVIDKAAEIVRTKQETKPRKGNKNGGNSLA